MAEKKGTKTFTEIESSEYILNLDYYLHRSILEAIGAVGLGIKQGHPKEGLLNLSLSVDTAVEIAVAKGMIKLEDLNKEVKEFCSKYSIDENSNEIVIQAKIARFRLSHILKKIAEYGVKHGVLII